MAFIRCMNGNSGGGGGGGNLDLIYTLQSYAVWETCSLPSASHVILIVENTSSPNDDLISQIKIPISLLPNRDLGDVYKTVLLTLNNNETVGINMAISENDNLLYISTGALPSVPLSIKLYIES